MARTGVSYFDIAQAAESIRHRGDEPTVDRVREELGTGSKSTIAPLLKRWKSETGDTSVDTAGLPKDLLDALKALHQRVQEEADRKVDAAREECAITVEQVQREVAQLRNTLNERNDNLRELEQKLQSSDEENRNLRKTLEDTQKALTKSEYQREEGSARVAELRADLDELKQENRTVREHFEHYQQRIADDRQQERDQFRQSNGQLNNQIANLNEQLALAGERIANREQKIEELRADLAQQLSERRETQQALATNRAEFESLQRSFAQQQELLQQVTTEGGDLREQVAILSNTNAVLARESELQREARNKLESEIKRQRDALASLSAEHQLAIQQRAELEGQLIQLVRTNQAPVV
ncbi:DNA-binding protein [Microbulbifer harenosus]|uniref:KfrA N-terminal DNA-binding domain-containing protein n=1 Tax=Microbulbifer harenosus TaxID=2576840 RepID=A0ABY2UFS6_9GAMM|nr:DNA-binding protein [Microbulbifer harenosus]TLM76430.1 hypothetical protein FDY93_13705 [Microbulbifer harenosus]